MRPTKLISALGFAVICAAAIPTVSAQSLAVTPDTVTGNTTGGATSPGTVSLVFTNGGANPGGYQADILFDNTVVSGVATPVSPAGHLVTCQTVAGGGPGGEDVIRIVVANLGGTAAADGTHCTIDLSLNASGGPLAAGTTYPLQIVNEVNVVDLTDGVITIIAEGPPTLTFDTTAVALPVGPYGSTQTGTIGANFTPSTGAHSVDYACTAPAGFTVTPAAGTYDNDDTAATDLTVSATLSDVAQSGTVTCTVTPSDGSAPTTFDIDVSAPAGTESAPALTPTPADGGEITVGGGAPGSNGTGTVSVAPAGGIGTDVAEVTCTATAPVSISPATLSFPVGSSAQSFTVTVPLTDVAQSFPNAINCSGTDGNGTIEWTFDVSAPAGTTVTAPTFIPATSLWSKFALIGVFAALGLLMVGLRRNH